mmetsp:Transcript_66110/g.190752  ORF Transcript_66110/g.190752 Transcript_66110/m.190752 type:complete len:350 (+) Transcript_66110:342-1391(+)
MRGGAATPRSTNSRERLRTGAHLRSHGGRRRQGEVDERVPDGELLRLELATLAWRLRPIIRLLANGRASTAARRLVQGAEERRQGHPADSTARRGSRDTTCRVAERRRRGRLLVGCARIARLDERHVQRGDATRAAAPTPGLRSGRGPTPEARQRHDNVADARVGDGADACESSVLEQLRQLRVAQRRLAQFNLELGPEHTLHVRKRDARRPAGGCLEDRPEEPRKRLPRGHRAAPAAPSEARVLIQRALILLPRLGAGVGHQCPVGVAQKLPLRDRKLHNVADLPQGHAGQERKPALREHLRASEAAAGKGAATGQGREVSLGLGPHVGRICVRRAINVHERLRPPHQ